MKAGDTIPDTMMNEEDKNHVEWIARHHGIVFFDLTMAMMIGAQSEKQELLSSTVSFSASNGMGTEGLFLDPHEGNSEDGAYFIALHEMAHSILKHHTSGKDDVTAEIEAWEWALSHAQHPPDDDTIEMMLNALATYTDNREARARPESLLALAGDPGLWDREGWDIKTFKPLALSGMDPVLLVNKEGKTREVPQPMARMIAEYIQYSVDYGRENLMENMRKTLEDPDIAQRLDKVAAEKGIDVSALRKFLGI